MGKPKRQKAELGKESKPRATRATRNAKAPASSSLALPFCLPGHWWVRADSLSHFKAENVIRTLGTLALVRTGESKRVLPINEGARNWTDDRYRDAALRFLRVGLELKAALFTRANEGKTGAAPLAAKATGLIDNLFALAQNGNKTAASRLAELLRNSVAQLTELAKARPELLRPTARKSWKWPVMKSRHPLLSDQHEDLLGVLNLGYDLPFHFDTSSHWRPDEFSRIALSLLFYLWGAQKERRGDFSFGRLGDLLDELPTFRKGENAAKWWEAAKAALLCSYPSPEEIRELADLVGLKKRTPGPLRRKILERIEQRFTNFAKP